MDDKDDKGYAGYIELVKEQRNEALEYVRMDEAVFAQYAAQFLRDNEVTPMPEDAILTRMETQDLHKKVTDWRTTNANMNQPHVDAPLPRGAPSHTPRRGTGITTPLQTFQHQRLFADTQPQVITTDPLTGPKTPHQTDVQNTASTDMARHAAFTNLNLGVHPEINTTLIGLTQGLYLTCTQTQ